MSLRPSELEQVCRELHASLTGSFIQKAYAPLPRLCYLEARIPGRSVLLCISAEPGVARLSVASARFPAPGEPPAFQRWLRQEVIGAKIVGVSHDAAWRIRIGLEHRGLVRSLLAELRGTSGNLLLVDGEDRVLAASVQEGERTRPGALWQLRPEDAEPDHTPSRLQPREDDPFPFASAAEGLFGPREQERRADEIRRRMTAPLKSRLTRIERTLRKVEAEASRGPDAERHRARGELISQNLFRIPRGARTVTLTEYTEEGPREVELALDPKRTPKEEAEWHFHQYRRLSRGCDHALRRLVELEEERDEVKAELEAMRERDAQSLLDNVEVLAAPRRKGPQRAKPYKEYRGHGGARILVGKGSEQNDELTFHLARPFDVWLHARGVPGSHVILAGEKNAEVPQEALLDAAHLAHHHSQRKGEPRGEVAWTQAKFVRKPKGAGPGQVTYTRERTMVVRIEPDRLERLLRARTDEV
jgi:predicted ribosome quality control (RQC) complex YloA/Tae2 family protein